MAVAAATKALESELNQLKNTAVAHRLEAYFEEMADLLAQGYAARNRFAIALRRDMDADERTKQFRKKFEQGILICYKLRCSIVHAGDTYLLYDNFDDADAFLLGLIEPLEKAIMTYLTIGLT